MSFSSICKFANSVSFSMKHNFICIKGKKCLFHVRNLQFFQTAFWRFWTNYSTISSRSNLFAHSSFGSNGESHGNRYLVVQSNQFYSWPFVGTSDLINDSRKLSLIRISLIQTNSNPRNLKAIQPSGLRESTTWSIVLDLIAHDWILYQIAFVGLCWAIFVGSFRVSLVIERGGP